MSQQWKIQFQDPATGEWTDVLTDRDPRSNTPRTTLLFDNLDDAHVFRALRAQTVPVQYRVTQA